MNKNLLVSSLLFGGILVSSVLTSKEMTREEKAVLNTQNFSQVERYEQFPAGSATHEKLLNGDAFSFPSNNMSFQRQLDFSVGNRLFTRNWVSSPSSTQTNGGVGPLFNARSCQACHFKDGRGHLPATVSDDAISLILKLQDDSNLKADAVYGNQLQEFSTQGVKPEAKIEVTYDYSTIKLADGEVVELRKPKFELKSLAHGDIRENIKLLPRIAPPMIGLGLLAAIDEKDILAILDDEDLKKQGVTGRVRLHLDESGNKRIGRFGWKSGATSLRQQTQIALVNDMGLSSNTKEFQRPQGDCTIHQVKCVDLANKYASKDGVEIPKKLLDSLTFYVRNLAVPARREPESPDVLAGKKIFYDIGCAACHKPKFVTRVDSINVEQSKQLIWPYTDMLLHDMGEGLSDPTNNRTNTLASEWRTPPLWGIGLTALVNREFGFLHDGRARTLLEAILWHGGEAEQSKRSIITLTGEERRKLFLFVNSL